MTLVFRVCILITTKNCLETTLQWCFWEIIVKNYSWALSELFLKFILFKNMLALHIAKIIKVFMVLGHFLTSNFIIFLKGKFSRINTLFKKNNFWWIAILCFCTSKILPLALKELWHSKSYTKSLFEEDKFWRILILYFHTSKIFPLVLRGSRPSGFLHKVTLGTPTKIYKFT